MKIIQTIKEEEQSKYEKRLEENKTKVNTHKSIKTFHF